MKKVIGYTEEKVLTPFSGASRIVRFIIAGLIFLNALALVCFTTIPFTNLPLDQIIDSARTFGYIAAILSLALLLFGFFQYKTIRVVNTPPTEEE
jgi:hypothetical protein